MRDVVGGSVEPTYTDPRQGEVRDSQADIHKAQELLGYTPSVSFEDGLERTIEWYRTARAA
jgi:nucleoside-diphosphate-sugar epimerase